MDTQVEQKQAIEAAIQRGVDSYFAQCHARIPSFIRQHFGWPGAIATNKVAWGWDLLRAPLNLFWAPIYALVCLIRFLLKRAFPNQRVAVWCVKQLARTPSGLTTQVQIHIANLIKQDLLGGDGRSRQLDDHILAQLRDVYHEQSSRAVSDQQLNSTLEPLISEALDQYQVTRTASADITNSLSCTLLGAFTFQKFTPGGMGIAFIVASLVSKAVAARDFIFGETLGTVYFSIFPPEPSLALTAAVMAIVMAILAAFAALSGVIIDPVQAVTGLHQRRLVKMLDDLKHDLLNETQGSFRPKDQFVARLMDSFDMIKSSLL